uniref:Uncharacterized protein n=1 Tax=candidate division CPR3 bacterium TaxID=2268181 RepID=A0A7C5YXT9_UNCC3
MATLYNVASTTKKILAVLSIGLLVFLVIKFVFLITDKLTNRLILRYSQETRGFGNLPSLYFQQMEGAAEIKPKFRIETRTGKLPSFPQVFNVYRLKQNEIDLSSEMFAKDVAKKFGFTGDPQKLSATVWLWEESEKTLEFNLQTKHFSYKNRNAKTIEKKEDTYVNENSYLLDRFLKEIGYNIPNSMTYTVTYQRKNGDKWEDVIENTAEWVRIDANIFLYYAQGAQGQIVSPTYRPSLVYVIVQNSSNSTIDNIAEMEYYMWSVEENTVQTYNAIPIFTAYEQLQKGMGVLVNAKYTAKNGVPNLSDIEEVRITDVKVGYFLSKSNLLYAQPIYIFYGVYGEGNNRCELIYYTNAIFGSYD